MYYTQNNEKHSLLEEGDYPYGALTAKDNNITEKPFTADKKTVSNLSRQIDKWLAGGMDKNEYFDIGDTPIVLQKLGANKLPVVMSQNVWLKSPVKNTVYHWMK